MRYLAFVGMGGLAFSALVLPLLTRRVRLHSLYGWMLISAFVGLVLRPAFLLIFSPDRAEQESFFWLNVPLQEFLWPTTVLSLGCLLLAASYILGNSNPAKLVRLQRLAGDNRLLATAGNLVAFVGIVAAISYVQNTGGFSIASLSTKRVIASEAAVAEGLATFGPTLAVGRAGLIGAMVSYHLRRRSQRPIRLAMLLVLANTFLPFYASDRTGVILVVLQLLALASMRAKKLDRRTLVAAGFVVLLLFQVLSTLRTTGRSDQSFALTGPIESVEGIIVNRSLFDLSKNLHVIRETGGVLEIKYGDSYAAAIAAPIPRSMWRDKPIISIGPEVGRGIYGNAVSGIPPGFLGEAYWNFLLPGLIAISLMFGWLVGRLDSLDRSRLSPFAEAVYVIAFLPLAYNAVASSFSGVVLDFLRDGLALVLLWFIQKAISLRGRNRTLPLDTQKADVLS